MSPTAQVEVRWRWGSVASLLTRQVARDASKSSRRHGAQFFWATTRNFLGVVWQTHWPGAYTPQRQCRLQILTKPATRIDLKPAMIPI
jgi:hypothetical protein